MKEKVKCFPFNSSTYRNVPSAKEVFALSRKLTQPDRSVLYEDLKKYGRFTGLCWLLSPEAPVGKKLPISTKEEIIFSEEFLQAEGREQQLDCLVQWCRIQVAEIPSSSDLTAGQRDNPARYLARRGHLTTSNFGCVLKAKRLLPRY